MFGDLGEGVTDENGECCVSLDDVFAETVSTGIEYQVFLQKRRTRRYLGRREASILFYCPWYRKPKILPGRSR